MEFAVFNDESETDPVAYLNRILVCRHVVRRKEIFDQSKALLKEIGYFTDYTMLKTLVDAQIVYAESFHGGMVTKDVITNAVKTGKANGTLAADDYAAAMELIELWWAEKPEYSDKAVMGILRTARKEFIDRQVMQRQEQGDDIHTIVSEAKRELDSDPFSRSAEADPFGEPERYLAKIDKFATGVSFLDEALDDGGQLGDFIGFVAPSGGGKTTLGIQICAAQVELKKHVAYFQTEQGIEGDITLRTYVQATKIGRSQWAGGWKAVSEDTRQAFEKVRGLWKTYFHSFALRDNMPKSIDELFSYVEELRRVDKAPTYVVIDWWGDIRDALMETVTKGNSETAARRAGRTWLKEVKAKADQCQCVVIVLQQLSGDAASKSPDRIQSSHSAQEDRNFNNRMDFCFTCSVLDSSSRTKIYSDKARRHQKMKCLVELDGERCMFRAVSADTNSKTMTVAEDDYTDAPKEDDQPFKSKYGLKEPSPEKDLD